MQGAGCRVQGVRCRVWVLWFDGEGLVFGDKGVGFVV